MVRSRKTRFGTIHHKIILGIVVFQFRALINKLEFCWKKGRSARDLIGYEGRPWVGVGWMGTQHQWRADNVFSSSAT